MKKESKFSATQIAILKVYITKLIAKKIHHPQRSDVEAVGITDGQVRHHFGNYTKLRKSAKKYSPETFVNIIDDEIFSPKVLANIKEHVGQTERFVITTAVTGCEVHKGFLLSLKRYCKKNKALLLILPSTDPASRAGWRMDSIIKGEHIVYADLALNSNCFISSIKTSAKQIDPITGLGRIGQRQGSFIYASPKQRLKVIPNAKYAIPRVMTTTGAITKPNYSTDRYMSERTAYISTVDHVMGALIVEVKNDRTFHFRHVQAEKSGAFIDQGSYYKPEGVGTILPAARVFGDYHAGQHDLQVLAARLRYQKKVPASKIFFHDIFNGLSINHHEDKKQILKAIRAMKGELNLFSELKITGEAIDIWSKEADELIIVKSNHDEFLDRYLDEGRYVKDHENKIVALEIALAMSKGNDPLKYAIEKMVGLKYPNKVKWLQRDDSYKIAGVELGDHGDKGGDGAYGSIKAVEHSHSQAIVGHAHTPEILRGIWRVGTGGLMDMGYNDGASGWMHTDCDLYPNGSRQFINIIHGSWGLSDPGEK